MSSPDDEAGLSPAARFFKRGFDLSVAVIGLLIGCWVIGLAWIVASIETRSNGFFVQRRVGRRATQFNIVKIKTMRDTRAGTTVTRDNDPRLTRFGVLMRKLKIDELPQLWNVLLGHMSLVGPRPDVPGFADRLEGEERLILSVRPGITGPATLKYRSEESMLAGRSDFERYNREVIWPDKVRINMAYVREWSFAGDLAIIWRTVAG